MFIPLHVKKSSFVLQNFSLSDLTKSSQEDQKKKKVEKNPLQTLHLLLTQIAEWGKTGCTALHTSNPSKASL